MRVLIYLAFVCLPFAAVAQPQVKEHIEKSNHVLTFIVDGNICMKESYIVIDGELVPNGIWAMYDKKGNNIYLIEHYRMGVLVGRLRIDELSKKQH